MLESLVGLVVIAGLLALNRRVRLTELGKLTISSEDEAVAIGAELLDYVKLKSHEPGREINVRPFWKGRDLSTGDKYAVMAPMFESEVLLIQRDATPFAAISELVSSWAFVPLPERVVLSPKEWHRMVHGGVSSWTIIAEQVDMSQTSNNNTNTGSGQIFAAQAGDHSTPRVTGNTIAQPPLSVDQLTQLAAALRHDSRGLDDAAAAPLLALADECDEAKAHHGAAAAGSVLKTATSYVSLMSGALEETSNLLQAFKNLV
jgi:hypothetical protein